jgi:outer membrane protein assembly factor BamD (BamD/ComL family)
VLLDIAYAALGQGEPARAFEALQQHARRFPESELREEREALAIQCLHDLGRVAELHRRATSFERRYPNSLFAPRVERALNEAAPPENKTPVSNP